jgi:pyruvate oxidase
MSKNVCDVILEVLADAGVKYIFGIPGGVINTMVDAIRRQDRIKMIHVRHEETGAFAASAQAKLSGQLAVCMGTSGPGAIHLLNGLYDAKLDHAPVIALTGQIETKFEGSDYHQEINIQSLFENVSVFSQEIISAEQLPRLIEEAVRASYFNHSVSQISMPMDIVTQNVPNPERRNHFVSEKPYIIPAKADLQRAADFLNNCEKIAILCGIGARDAVNELLQVADLLKSPIKALRGKDIIPDEHPYCMGGLGLLGTVPGYRAVEDCDCLFMIGTDFPYVEFLPEKIKAVQIDINGYQLGKRVPVEVGLAGDAASTLAELIPLLIAKKGDSFLQECMKRMGTWRKDLERYEKSNDQPIHPQALAATISRYANDDAIYCCDTGNVTVWAARNIMIRGSQRFTLSGGLASMAFGMPAAIGAKLLYPHRQVIALCGDGGFAMLMGDFLTAVQYNLAIIVVVFNNHKLGMIQAEEEVMGLPEFEVQLHNCDFAEFGRLCGGDGRKVTDTHTLEADVKYALLTQKPFILDVEVNARELPYPPKITAKEAFGFAKAKVREFFGEGISDESLE